MDPKQVPPQVGVNSGSVGSSATGSPIFANPANGAGAVGQANAGPAPNRFQDTNPKGDIIIPSSDGSSSSGSGAKKPVNKKLIIGIIVAIVVLVVAIILVIVLTGGNKSGKSGVKSNSSSSAANNSEIPEDVWDELIGNINGVYSAEKTFNKIYAGEISVEKLFAKNSNKDGSSSDLLNSQIDTIKNLKIALDNFGKTPNEYFVELKEEVDRRVPLYEETVKIFDALYTAYNSAKPESSIKSLMNNDDEDIVSAATVFNEYYSTTSSNKRNSKQTGDWVKRMFAPVSVDYEASGYLGTLIHEALDDTNYRVRSDEKGEGEDE